MDAEQAAELKRRRVMLALSGRVKPSCYLDMKGVVGGDVGGGEGGCSEKLGGIASKGDVSKGDVSKGDVSKDDMPNNNTLSNNTLSNNTLNNNTPQDNTSNDTTPNDTTPNDTTPNDTTPLPRNPNTLHSVDTSSDSSAVEGALSDSEEVSSPTSLS